MPHLKSAIRHLKSVFCLLIFPFALSLAPYACDAIAASVTLGWDSNPEPDLEGYVVYRNVGSPGPPYDYSDTLPEDDLADPLHPEVRLTGLKEGGKYYISLTAYNTDGIESNFSNAVCVKVLNNLAAACSASSAPPASTPSSSSGSGGNNNGSCFISASSGDSSMFSQLVAGPASRSRLMVIMLLLLILTAAVTFKKLIKNSSWPIVQKAIKLVA